jgi:hypothetical protein
VVSRQGDSYEEALAEVRSAIEFHVETFGSEVLEEDEMAQEVFVAESRVDGLIPKFPVDAPKEQVIRAFQALGVVMVREGNHIAMVRENADGTRPPLTMPNQPPAVAAGCNVPRRRCSR